MSTSSTVNRREMIAQSSAAVAAALIAQPARSAPTEQEPLKKVAIGLVADVHQDVVHDGRERIAAFVREMQQRDIDAALQLGDFALPHKFNQPFLEKWNELACPRYHVLGNHDMDHGFSKQQTMEWWGMPERYYSFDVGGWHFVVLDGNDRNPGQWSGYVRYVAEDQLEWLAEDLAATAAPTIVFSHQMLESDSGVANSGEVRKVLESANRNAGQPKVLACLCGHHHTDALTEIAGIRYIHVNSMSYKWVGGQHQHKRFPDHIEQAHPYLSHTCLYRDPLYTTLTLDPDAGTLSIEGSKTTFVAPTPKDLKLRGADSMLPTITQRSLNILPNSD